MKKLLFLNFLLFWAPFGLAKWSLKTDFNAESAVYESSLESILSVSFHPDHKQQLKVRDIKKNQDAKAETLQYIGIHEWQAKKGDVSNKKGVHKISFDGSYKDRRNTLVYFKEIYLQKKGKALQILVSNSNKKALKKDLQTLPLKMLEKKYGF